MVSTRSHPDQFPPPDLSPSKSSSPATPSSRRGFPNGGDVFRDSGRSSTFAHAPTNLTLLWLIVSLPLVAWDTGYILLRPHSMPGGKFHWPLWVPYELYG